MRRWAETAEAVRSTRKTSEKTAIVADYLESLADADIAIAAAFFSGRAFAEADPRKTGLGWAAISATAQAVAGVDDGALGEAYDRSSDLGTSVEAILTDAGHVPLARPRVLRLADVAAAYGGLADARGRAAKEAVFAALLARCDPLSARYVTGILSGELRIGFRSGHLEAAIARGFERGVADVQWAGMLTGDIGRTAVLARHDELGSAQLVLFHPLKSMLASPVLDEAEALDRLAPPVWVEDKYDGIRAQLHRQGDRVQLFSRDLNDITGQFPEVVEAAASLPWSGILDGEILAWKDGAVLPFLQLQTRLGRKQPSAAIRAKVPVIYVAFDVMALGDDAPEPLLRESLRLRRERLETLALDKTPGFGLASLVSADDAVALELIFAQSQARGNEGLMLKDAESIYAPGRRGYAWLKLKKARLCGRGRRGRAWSATRGAVGLHVRGAR